MTGKLGSFLDRAGAGAAAVEHAMKNTTTQMLEVDLIERVEGLNPRGSMTGESAFAGPAYEDLKASILQRGGLLQPVIVRPHPDLRRGGHYQLIAGERRWRAVNDLGFPKILALVLSLNDQEIHVVVRHENELREGLTEIDRKVSMLRAIAHDAGLTPGELLTVFLRLRKKPDEAWPDGSTEALVAQSMVRLNAPSLDTLIGRWSNFLYFTSAECEALASKKVSEGVLVALSKLPADTDPEVRQQLLTEAIDKKWTTKDMTSAVSALNARPLPPARAKAAALALTRTQVQASLSKSALKDLELDAQEKLLEQIQALIQEAKGG